MSKRKKVVIVLSVMLVAVLGLLVTLSLTTFSLKDIRVDFRTSRINSTASQEDIVQAGGFKKSCVFFYNKQKSIDKIEREFPYLKVVNIETVFPSSFVVHVAERGEVYMIAKDNKTYYLDETLRVLKIVEGEEESLSTNPIKLVWNKSLSGVEVGQSLYDEDWADMYCAFLQSNLDLGMQKEMFKEIEFKVEFDSNAKTNYLNGYITLFSGQIIKILDVKYGLEYKTNLAHQVFSQLYTFIGKEYVLNSQDKIVISKEMLDDVTIVVQSYYDRASHKQNECYFLLEFAK